MFNYSPFPSFLTHSSRPTSRHLFVVVQFTLIFPEVGRNGEATFSRGPPSDCPPNHQSGHAPSMTLRPHYHEGLGNSSTRKFEND